ncbi:MAG TPA: ABC transporter permease [Gemmatimonadales bacterium]|nr:ABC transporter permease [Gemmatimonadales bacterium]
MILYHLRHAFRRLRREPGFTAAAVLTLALGVGANVAVFALVEAVLLRPLPYDHADEIVVVRHRDTRTGITKEFIAGGDWVDLAARQQSFQTLGSYGYFEGTIYGEGDPYQVPVLGATPALLDALGFKATLGRGFTPEDAVPGAGAVMILGNELWRNRFGSDPNIVGRSIKLGGNRRTVVGVAPPGFRFPPNTATALIINQTPLTVAPAVRKSQWTLAAGRLKPGKTAVDASAELAAIAKEMEADYPDQNRGSTYYAVALRDDTVGDAKKALLLLLAAVGAVLLIACTNVANLLLARSLSRRREMAVRLTLGAGRGRLVTQLMMESLALSLVAGVAGIVVAHFGARGLATLVPESLSAPGLADVGINGPVLLFTLMVVVLTAVACGVIAALTTPMSNAAGLLVVAGRATMSAAARRATSALVAAEMAFAVVLLIGAGLILRSFAGLLSVDPGFQSDNVLTMQIAIPADRYQPMEARWGFYDRALESLRNLPGVLDVGAAVVTPLTGNNWTVPFERADQPVPSGERPPDVGWQAASGGWFRAMQVPLVSGRLFDERDRPGSPQVVIISEGIATRFFGSDSAVGRSIRLGPEATAEIVGVVGDIRRAGLTDAPRADMYFAALQGPGTQMTLFVRTQGDPVRAIAPARAALRAVEPDVAVFDTPTMSQVASDSVRVTKLVLWLLGIFAAVSLGLAAVGIYGVMSYVVRQRAREIGTRIALGAARTDILWLVLRQGVMIAGAGTVIGLGVGLGAARALRSMLYGVSATDPLVLAGAAVLLVMTALVACYVPALRAARVDPARTLAEQ